MSKRRVKPKIPRKRQLRDEPLLKEIAFELKEMRKRKGLTLHQVFIDTSIHVGRIESGKSNSSISTLKALCKYYNTSLKELLKNH